MYRIIEGNTLGLADADNFVALINEPPSGLRDLFEQGREIIVTRAPGRLDVMGGIADYSGSLVLEMPIAEATFAAIQKTNDRVIRIVSLFTDSDSFSTFEMDLAELCPTGGAIEYGPLRVRFESDRRNRWAGYAAGVFYVLKAELGVEFDTGAHILIRSNVPVGKGVSSSAALEVAVMQAVCSAYEIRLDPRDLALFCQMVENKIVGAACGVMDQVTASCGVENALTSLLCQPAEIGDPIRIPDGIEFWGIDSGVRHAVAGSDYSSVRVGAFMGYRIIVDRARLNVRTAGDGLVEIDDIRWNGYLANVSPEEYESRFSFSLPVAITGSEFLKSYGGTTDSITTIDRGKTYAVKAPTEHAIYESSRVRAFAELLKDEASGSSVDALGELMFQSHRSYSSCGLTELRTDRIVDLVADSRDTGLFGARITGGGSGGTVVVLARQGSLAAIIEISEQFGVETGKKPYLFHGSSPGCAAFGFLRLRWA